MKQMTVADRRDLLKDFMECNCVGESNTMTSTVIALQMRLKGIYNYLSPKQVTADIHYLRNKRSFSRKVGSSRFGYWLMLRNEDRGHRLLKTSTTTQIITCLVEGVVDKAFFYKIINEIDATDTVDRQKKAIFESDDFNTVHRYSDDLNSKKNDIENLFERDDYYAQP